MRRLILVGVLGLALPAFAAEEVAPAPLTTEATKVIAAEEVAPAPELESAEAPAEVEPQLAEAVSAPAPVPSDAVARGTFATAIAEREPVDSVTSLSSDRDHIYYFTEFVGIEGRQLTHRWEYQGEVVAEVPIAIGGPRWRAYSSKSLDESWLGEWSVSVIDESGRVVHTDSFVYEVAAPEPEVAVSETTPEAPPVAPAAPAASPAAAEGDAAP